MQILDYAAGYPGARAVKAAGYGGVIRYLRKEGSSWVKPITAAELTDMRAHGLAVAVVYQAVSTSRILSGRPGGRHDAQWAQARARDIGVPDPRCIYFAADRDIVGRAQLDQVLAYLDGAASVLGRDRVGVYGEYDVISAALPGHAAYGWQTAAWSGGRRSREAHLYQRVGQPLVGGIRVDINDVLKPDFGQLDMEDDMQPTDPAKDPGGGKWGHVWLNTNYLINSKVVGLGVLNAKLNALTQAVANLASDPEVTPQQMQQWLDQAVAKALPLDAVEAIIRDAVPDEQAEAILDRLAEKLSAG